MADKECDCEGIDNGDVIDQCIVWLCTDVRWATSLHCEAHQGFAHVEQEENNGS